METYQIIKNKLEEKGIKQSKIATVLHCSEPYISLLLSGKRVFPENYVSEIAVFLNIPVDDLKGETNHE